VRFQLFCYYLDYIEDLCDKAVDSYVTDPDSVPSEMDVYGSLMSSGAICSHSTFVLLIKSHLAGSNPSLQTVKVLCHKVYFYMDYVESRKHNYIIVVIFV